MHFNRILLQAIDGAILKGEKLIHEKLVKSLEPTLISVKDVSGGCGAMYEIKVQSHKFQGISMVKQHRIVYDILKEEVPNIHGLQIETNIPK